MNAAASTMPTVKLHPVLEAVLDFPADPISSSELAGITGHARCTISDAYKDGIIANHACCLRRKGKVKHARRAASKAAIIEWLWDTQEGQRTMMRAVLEVRAPRVLATLDRRDSKSRLSVLPKAKAEPEGAARPVAQLLLFSEAS